MPIKNCFTDSESLGLFEKLITVSGIGPKSALGIVNLAPVSKLVQAISAGDAGYLTKVSGIGKKTAAKIVVELKAVNVLPGIHCKQSAKFLLQFADAHYDSEIASAAINASSQFKLKTTVDKLIGMYSIQEAEKMGSQEEMRKYASRTTRLTKEMIIDAKNLITALGLPIIQAPSEGEAQTAYLVKKGDAYASLSQDYDNLIFGCPRLIRNLSVTGRRKKAGKAVGYITVSPEMIELPKVLAELKLTNDQLIVLAILIGTDYNPGGIKGIGPRKALKLLQDHKDDFEKIFSLVKWDEQYPERSWLEIFNTIKHIPVTDKYELSWKKIDEKKITHLLVEEHGFGLERVQKKLDDLRKEQKILDQKGLSSFF